MLNRTRELHHPHCIVCNPQHSVGLAVSYRLAAGGGVEAVVQCQPHWEGYDGIVHGGVIAALVDSAMTNCLFAEGIAAVTAELTIKFRHPLSVGSDVKVSAQTIRRSPPIFSLTARIEQLGQLCVTAGGKFVSQHRLNRPASGNGAADE